MKFLYYEDENLKEEKYPIKKPSFKELSSSIEHTCMKTCVENTFLNNLKLKKHTPYK